ncbi:hypothetical protein [Jeotgalibacillus malaysiensis]|uniref:hypothetical protein n=1 Tax=Jeotgalibacillus malaysiensis TaxID=1508404 RepID=UPI00384EF2C6
MMKGEVDLAARVREVFKGLDEVAQGKEGILTQERAAVEAIRHLFLVNAGLVYEASCRY